MLLVAEQPHKATVNRAKLRGALNRNYKKLVSDQKDAGTYTAPPVQLHESRGGE